MYCLADVNKLYIYGVQELTELKKLVVEKPGNVAKSRHITVFVIPQQVHFDQ